MGVEGQPSPKEKEKVAVQATLACTRHEEFLTTGRKLQMTMAKRHSPTDSRMGSIANGWVFSEFHGAAAELRAQALRIGGWRR